MFDLDNGNGGAVNGTVVRGRGLHHRKLSHKQLVALAADVVTGEKPFEPSLAQYSSIFGITPAALRTELKLRAVANGNGCSEQADPIDVNLIDAWAGVWAGFSEAERKHALQVTGLCVG